MKEYEKLNTLGITKDIGGYYAIVTLENTEEQEKAEESYIIYSPNHKGLTGGIDHRAIRMNLSPYLPCENIGINA